MTAVVYTEKGEQLTLTAVIGKGGEGTIYASPRDPLECAKIYLKPGSDQTHKKLCLMVQNSPVDPTYQVRKHRSISWPSGLLYQDVSRTTFVGFFMPKIDLKAFQKALVYIDPSDRCARFGGGFTWKHLFTSAMNIASAVAAINDQGYCVGDLNESNVLIAPNALASLIDCDSFQVRDPQRGTIYRCEVGKPEYTAPEFVGKRFNEVDRTIDSDSFALAVLIFQLLMDGTHPYQAKGKLVENAPSTEAKIRLGYFPYAMRGPDIAPPDHAPPYEVLHPEIQRLFQLCFLAGHSKQGMRPTARQWYESLRRLDGGFKQCQTNLNHEYLDNLRSCPWCKVREVRGRDPFPSPIGHQIALESTATQLDSLEKRLEYLKPYLVMAFADGVLTNEEQSYLTALGSKLQIPSKELERAIQAEAKRAQGKFGSSPGSPKLEVSQTTFEFGNIRRGTALSGRFVISNVGGGSLQGSMRSDRSWLKPSQNSIDPARHRQEHGFTVDSASLTLGSQNRGTIAIDSNGGRQSIYVSVSVELEAKALSRFRNRLFWFGVFLGAVGGYGGYTYVANIQARGGVALVAGLVAPLFAVIFGAKLGKWAGGIGAFFLAVAAGETLKAYMPAYSAGAWATIIGCLLCLSARTLLVGRHAKKVGPLLRVSLWTVGVVAAIVVAGLALAGRIVPREPSTIVEDFHGSVKVGHPYGITFGPSLNGQGAVFTRSSSSRIEYPVGIPSEGTLEFLVNISSGYQYEDFRLHSKQACAEIFTTDVQGGDVTWPGSTWLVACRNGDVSLDMGIQTGANIHQTARATGTQFRFNEWHAIGISYGSNGQSIMVDGRLVASEPTHRQTLGAGGDHTRPKDVPTIGESVSGFWQRHRYEGGFEGTVGGFRASAKESDWVLAARPPVANPNSTLNSEGQASIAASPQSVMVTVQSLPGADVYVDGVLRGSTDDDGSIAIGNLEGGSHVLLIRKDGYDNFQDTITLAVGQALMLPAQLRASSPDQEIPTVGNAEPDQSAIHVLLSRWTDSLHRRDLDAQMECYAPALEVYFKRVNVSREAVRTDKERAFAEFSTLDVSISDVSITADGPNRAIVRFKKTWDFKRDLGKPFFGEEQDQLVVSKGDMGWEIVAESQQPSAI